MSAAPLGLDHSAAPSRPSRSRWLGDSGSLRALWPMAAALVALAGGRLALDAARLGPVAGHMGAHILLMNAVAPLLALAVLGRFPALAGHFASGRMLLAASLAQLAALWAWHAPAALAFALGTPGTHALSQAWLFMAALAFWLTVLSDRSAACWRALFALLLSGKLFCLLGVLLVFAPRPIYPDLAAAHGYVAPPATEALSDQQLAGLLMLVACPLSYLLAGVTIAARWLAALAGKDPTEHNPAGPA